MSRASIPERKKDMITMNRFYFINSERKSPALLRKHHEQSLDFICSFKVKYKRGNCADIYAADSETLR